MVLLFCQRLAVASLRIANPVLISGGRSKHGLGEHWKAMEFASLAVHLHEVDGCLCNALILQKSKNSCKSQLCLFMLLFLVICIGLERLGSCREAPEQHPTIFANFGNTYLHHSVNFHVIESTLTPFSFVQDSLTTPFRHWTRCCFRKNVNSCVLSDLVNWGLREPKTSRVKKGKCRTKNLESRIIPA